MGLEEDIDDLRADLLDALPDYEQRLRRRTGELPDWLKLSPARLRALFHFDDDSIEADGLLGPRTVALGAGRVEEFVERWLHADPAALDESDTVETLAADYTEACEYLDRLDAEAERVAVEAHRSLESWLDAVLTQLDDRREEDIDAIEQLVQEGEIRRGGRARQEIADLWEEQRHQAAELQACWAPIVALVEEGGRISAEGLSELRGMIGRARQGLIGAQGSLTEHLPAPVRAASAALGAEADPPEPQPDEASASVSVDADMGPTAPAILADGSGERPDEPSKDEPSKDEPDEAPENVSDEEPVEAAPPEGVDEIDAVSDTVPDSTYVPGIVPLEEPTSEPESSALETSSVSDYSEPELSEPSSASSSAETPTQRMFTRSEASATAPADQTHETPVGSDVDEPADAPEDASASAEIDEARATLELDEAERADLLEESAAPVGSSASAGSDEAFFTTCFRIRPGYKRVGAAEIAGVLLPPALVFLAMGALSAGHLAGVDAAFNPFARWSWAVAAVAVACAWLLLIPTGLRWRTKWRGWRPIIMRHTDVRQHAELSADAGRLNVAEDTWAWSDFDEVTMRRWDSPLDEVCGWALRLSPADGEPVFLVAPESDRRRWQNSPYQLDDVPYEAWQLDPHDFDTIRNRVL